MRTSRSRPPRAPKPASSPRRARPRLWQVLVFGALVLVGATGLAGTSTSPAHGSASAASAPARYPEMAPARHGLASRGLYDVDAGPAATGTSAASAGVSAPPAPGATVANGTTTSPSVSEAQPRIQKTGNLVLFVPARQVDADLAQATGLATGVDGYVLSSATQAASAGQPAQATATLQVPVADFESILAQLEQLGHVSSLTTKANDLTGQYVDLQAQLQALQASRQQYLTIMARAKSIGSVLAVQEQLDGIDSQIQQLQSEQQLMDNETSYSTIDVTLTQATAVPLPRPVPSGLQKAWNGAVSGFESGVDGVVRLAGPIAFALLLVAAFALAGRWAWGWRRRPGRRAPAVSTAENA